MAINNWSLQLGSPKAAAPSTPLTLELAIGGQDKAAKMEFLFKKRALSFVFFAFLHYIVYFICAVGGTRVGSLEATLCAVNSRDSLVASQSLLQCFSTQQL